MNKKLNIDLGRILTLKCGRNEHQAAALYGDGTEAPLDQLQGAPPSFYDLVDMELAGNIVSHFGEQTFAITRMNTPVAVIQSKHHIDSIAKYDLKHCSIACNREIRNGIITKILETKNYPNCLVAPSFEEYAQDLAKGKRKFPGDSGVPLPEDTKIFRTSVQQRPFGEIVETRWGYLVSEADNLPVELEGDEKLAWITLRYTKSYAIVAVKDGETIYIKSDLRQLEDFQLDDWKRYIVATDWPMTSEADVEVFGKAKRVLFTDSFYEGNLNRHMIPMELNARRV